MEENQRKQKELDSLKENLALQTEILQKKQQEVDKGHKRQLEQLEAISGLKSEEAKAQLVEALKNEAKTAALSHIKATPIVWDSMGNSWVNWNNELPRLKQRYKGRIFSTPNK